MKKFIFAIFVFIALTTILTYASDYENIIGIWQGTMSYPGLDLRVAFKFEVTPDSKIKASMFKPDEGEREIPVSKIAFEGSNLYMEIASIGSFEGQFLREEGVIKGQLKQGQKTFPLILKRVSEISKPKRPQTPIPPYPYNQEEVTFSNKEANFELAGTLTWPKEGYPCPAVILIPGTGAHDRDYFILNHRPFLVLSDYLTRQGIAVLRFDERGVGTSKGDRLQATSEDYAQDAMAGFQFLKGRKEIDASLIGFIGHSEGGTIASLIAANSSDVAYIVIMGTPGLPGVEYNYQYEESMGRIMGLSEEVIAAKRAFQERVFDVVINEKDYTAAEKKLHKMYEELDPKLPEDKKNASVKRFLSPWFRFNINHDPGVTLKNVKCPVLAIIGEKDMHVPTDGNLQAIKYALETSGNSDYKVKELSGLNHFLQTAETGSPFEYGKIEETISPAVLDLIGNWILEHTGKD